MSAAQRNAATRASPSSIYPERGYTSEGVNHELRFSLEGGQRRPYHMRLQFDQARNEIVPDTIAPAISVAERLPARRGLDHGHRSRSLRDGRYHVHARRASLYVAGWLVDQLRPQRAGAVAQLTRHVHVHRSRGLRPWAADDVYAAPRRAAVDGRRDAGSDVRASRVCEVAVELRRGRALRSCRAASAIAARLRRAWASRAAFRRNTTNFRAGYGWFYGWMPVRIEEESIRLAQGSTEEEVIIQQSVLPEPV